MLPWIGWVPRYAPLVLIQIPVLQILAAPRCPVPCVPVVHTDTQDFMPSSALAFEPIISRWTAYFHRLDRLSEPLICCFGITATKAWARREGGYEEQRETFGTRPPQITNFFDFISII